MWLKQHPNWTIFFAWVIAIVIVIVSLITVANVNFVIWWFILGACILLVWGTLAWSLSIKERSYCNLFFLLIPFFGWIIIWGLSNQSINREIEF